MNEYFPSRTSITVDDRGRLIIKTRNGEPFVVDAADVRDFIDSIVNLGPDIKAMSFACSSDRTATKED